SDLPHTDLYTFGISKEVNLDPEPIPGHVLRPGRPAPTNARLSLGMASTPGATTTLRLVKAPFAQRVKQPCTPKLKPFKTSFDLVPETPAKEIDPFKEEQAVTLNAELPVPCSS